MYPTRNISTYNTVDITPDYLKKEDGDFLTLEDGGLIELEQLTTDMGALLARTVSSYSTINRNT